MQMKLLLCDIGNTSIKVAFAGKDGIISAYSFPVHRAETADSLGLLLLSAFKLSFSGHAKIHACVVSSVVPDMDELITAAAGKYFNCPALFAKKDIPVPLQNEYARPEETGADILVGAYEARMLFPDARSVIAVDYGTAATFACVTGKCFLGGLIFPGPETAMKALVQQTAKLPRVRLEYPGEQPIQGKDTATCIQHGIMFGYKALTEGICRDLAQTMEKPVKYVITGGIAPVIKRLCPIFDEMIPNLVLNGLARLFFEYKQAV